jgi:hypothetical protein
VRRYVYLHNESHEQIVDQDAFPEHADLAWKCLFGYYSFREPHILIDISAACTFNMAVALSMQSLEWPVRDTLEHMKEKSRSGSKPSCGLEQCGVKD